MLWKTRYAMQTFNEECRDPIIIRVCCIVFEPEPLYVSLLCAFDNFVRIMASARIVSFRRFLRLFVGSCLVRYVVVFYEDWT